tara:strand:+ start:438 stop:1391 length:954 start_codon:yes stop_codon:yes gene_type:complete
MNILYLCDKKYYDSKMSRVRFHSVEAISKIKNVVIWGNNWPDYNSNNTVQKNIDNLGAKFDLVIGYKPLDHKKFCDVDAIRCVRYNEMYDRQWTVSEIMQSKANLVVCHHENDFKEYNSRFQNFKIWPIKFVHIAHCAEQSVFKDYKMPKKYDIFLGGATNGHSLLGRHYPLRDRILSIMPIIASRGYKCHVHKHPGYDLSDAHTNKYAIDFAKEINSSKIAITCSGAPKSRFGKYVEIPMCNVAVAADIPDEDQDNFNRFVIEINMSMTDEEIVDKLVYYLQNEEERNKLALLGFEWSKNYTHEKYAERFVEAIKQ